MDDVLASAGPMSIFSDDIFKLLKLEDIAQEVKDKIIENAVSSIQSRVLGRVMDSLDDPEREEFMRLVADPDPKKAEEYLKTKEINIEQLTAQEALYYKSELLDLVTGGEPADVKEE